MTLNVLFSSDRHPHATALAELLQQVMELNSRLEPHLERYHRITHEDLNYDGDVSEHQRHRSSSSYIYKRSQS